MLLHIARQIAISLTMIFGVIHAAVADDTSTLRVVTYNIHHGEGTDRVVDLERIAAVITACDPHIVCLQEVDRNLPRTDHIDMPVVLAEALAMDVVFEANYRFDGGEYGNATLTRLPIVAHENLRLPGPDGVEPRGCLRVDVRWEGETVSVFNTHWGLKPEERLEQANATARFMEGHSNAILAGDLNAAPNSKPLAVVLENLADSAVAAFGREASELHTVRGRRIDYILGLRATGSGVVRNAKTEIASDHFPYTAELELKK